jgi:hypothetical protein
MSSVAKIREAFPAECNILISSVLVKLPASNVKNKGSRTTLISLSDSFIQGNVIRRPAKFSDQPNETFDGICAENLSLCVIEAEYVAS